MAATSVWFHDIYNQRFKVVALDQIKAREHIDWIVATHNIIPFQFWGRRDVLAEQDDNRKYLGKWEISRIALSESGDPLAFCIGFELRPDDQYYSKPGVYLHRLAVAQGAQGKMIGVLLQTETIAQIFKRGLRYVGSPQHPVLVWGQTNKILANKTVVRFHQGAGFRIVGEKSYPDRIDVIMRMDATDFWNSHHVRRWRMQRDPE